MGADVWMANVDMKVECNWQFSLYGLPIRSCGTSWLQVGLAEKDAETALHKHQTLKHSCVEYPKVATLRLSSHKK